MLAAEVVLIIIGIACISVSFFIAGRKKADEEAEEPVRASDIWTEKDEEVIIRHVDEILSERGMELVDTTEDQMNRICNEKIMAIDEFSKQLLDKIHVNHEEVVFMYNMLGEKRKEIETEVMQETVDKSVPVINPVHADESVSASVPVSKRDDDSETFVERSAEQTTPRRQEAAETAVSRLEAIANVAPERGVLTGLQRAQKKAENKLVKADEHVNNNVESPQVFVTDKPIPETEEAPSSLTDKMRRPTKESVMKSISENTAGRNSGEVEDRIRELYRQGKSVMDISKEMNIGQGEVKLMIALLKKRS